MKTLSGELKNFENGIKSNISVLCEYVLTPWGEKKVEPFQSIGHNCEFCGFSEFYTPLFQGKKIWQCAKLDCAVVEINKSPKATTIQVDRKRAVEWPLFCEINGIGNANHGVTFESIRQADKKLEYMRTFLSTPKGSFIVMFGPPGSGKTYCSLGMCEFKTRTTPSVLFMTQKEMAEKWLQTFSFGGNFISQLKKVDLLVIDDFGTGEMSSSFLTFFMDVINTRMDSLNCGTIITTNLNGDDFAHYCGDALSDRLATGQDFIFQGQSKRTKKLPI